MFVGMCGSKWKGEFQSIALPGHAAAASGIGEPMLTLEERWVAYPTEAVSD
jgi:hypothetical protein